MWIDWDYPQSAVALHIYRVGRSVPVRSQNPIKSCVKIQLLTRTGRSGPVWPVSGPVRPGCRSSGRHNSLIRTPNWTFYICISTVSTRSTQWCSRIGNLTNFSRPVWLVSMRGLTSLSRLPRKPYSCQFWVSTYAPLFLSKACVLRNISPSPKMHLNNEKHLRTNHVLLWRTISYIGHVILYKWDKPEYIQPRLWIMSFKGTASVHLVK